jgi:fatty acid desaturase
VIPLFAYGTLYGSTGDSRWHECGHGTAFKTRWMNDAVYQIACFMMIREPEIWRWSHTRHHSDTIIVGRDPEIVAERPPTIPIMIANLLTLHLGVNALKKIVIHATGRLLEAEKTFIPEQEQWKVYFVARVWLVVLAGVLIWSVAVWSILPLMFVGLPTFYGGWLHGMFAITQHVGLAEDVVDHRLNTRTIYFNPVFRFSYLNMNYHIEHHMFPMVPYHALPRLHEMIKHDLPRPNTSILDGYRDMSPAFLRQLRNEDYFLKRELPASARPYRPDLHSEPLAAAAE